MRSDMLANLRLYRHHGAIIQFTISFTLIIDDLLGLLCIRMHEFGDLTVYFLRLSILIIEGVKHLI